MEITDNEVTAAGEKVIDQSILHQLHLAIENGWVNDPENEGDQAPKGIKSVLDEIDPNIITDYLVEKYPIILEPKNSLEEYSKINALQRAAESNNPEALQYVVARMSQDRWYDFDEWDPLLSHAPGVFGLIEKIYDKYDWFKRGNLALSQQAVKCAQVLIRFKSATTMIKPNEEEVLLQLLERTADAFEADDEALPAAVAERLEKYSSSEIWNSSDLLHELGLRFMGSIVALKLKAATDQSAIENFAYVNEASLNALAFDLLFGPLDNSYGIGKSESASTREWELFKTEDQSAIDRYSKQGLPLDIVEFLEMSKQWHLPHEGLPKEIFKGKPVRTWHTLADTNRLTRSADLVEYTLVELTNSDELEIEGEVMEHCVGKGHYEDLCAQGKSHIFSVLDNSNNRQATLELSYNEKDNSWEVKQLFGKGNTKVSGSVRQMVAEFASDINEGKYEINEKSGETEESKKLFEESGWSPVDKTVGFRTTPDLVRTVFDYYLHMAWGSSKSGIRSLFAPTGAIQRFDDGGGRAWLYADFGRQQMATVDRALEIHSPTIDLLIDSFIKAQYGIEDQLPAVADLLKIDQQEGMEINVN